VARADQSVVADKTVFDAGRLRACPQLSQMIAAARWIAARKFLAVLS